MQILIKGAVLRRKSDYRVREAVPVIWTFYHTLPIAAMRNADLSLRISLDNIGNYDILISESIFISGTAIYELQII